MKEYIVTLKAGVDYDAFYDAMVQSSTETLVPNREVEIANERPLSQRNTHYFLTDHEADTLQKDPRVLAVEIPPDQRDDIKISPFVLQSSNFNKTTSDSGPFVNWGLLRCGFVNNATYGSTGFPAVCAYPYHLDGTGVDVVVHDSGLQIDHPEFTDKNNASRVQQINWYAASGIAGTQSVNFYRDYHGHGTHVGGTMCGKTYGWAKNARVYALKVNGLEGYGDYGTGIPITYCFDVVKGWHLNKPVDPATGKKRPTVVNMSWGYGTSYSALTGGNYRGTNWVASSPNSSYGMINITGRVPVRIASVDTDLEELIQAGVTVCVAAGNDYFKMDVPGGDDYDNYFSRSGGAQVFYHRGSSPCSLSAIMVGCVNSVATPTEYKMGFSNGGPGVDVYAPGTDIMSSCSNTDEIGGVSYFLNSSYKQANISGTSMASPQTAGMCALFHQLNPDALPHQVKMFTIKTATSGALYDTAGSSTSYTGTTTLYGGNNRYLRNPYASNTGMIYTNIYQGIPVQQQNILNTARDEVVVFYNQNSTDSVDVANYYKTKRPNFSKVNTVGLNIPYQIYPQRRSGDGTTIISQSGADIGVPYEGCRKYDLIHNINFNASVIAPMQAYLASNIKTKYIVCSLDMPLHIINQTSTAVPYLTTLASVSGVPYHISKNTGIFPFYLAGEYREDVLAYIDKLSRASADGIKLYTNRLSAYAEDSNLYSSDYFSLYNAGDNIYRALSGVYFYRTGRTTALSAGTTSVRQTTGMFCNYSNAWPHNTGNLSASSMCYFGSWGFNGRRFINPNGPYIFNISGEGEVAGLSAISYYTDPASSGKLTFNNPQKIDNWSFVYTMESFNASPGGGSYGPYTALVPSWGLFPTSYTGVKTFSAFKMSWQYAAGMRPIRHSHFTQYFSKSAFGGSNYENTAVNWVGSLYEPYYPGAVNDTHITAWLSGSISYDCVTNNFANKFPALAIGDPLVFVKTPLFNTIIS